ncbi:TPA: hypothetical protein RQL04_004425 [Vibrio vulnificus]|nr:hypothetical protein [Vibrio vulnificus]
MESAVKIIQILFYITGSVVAVLTFLKAKNGLLNTVNTEYQKKVLERLHQISEDIWEEFDFSSDKHWSKEKDLDEVIDRIHTEARKFKHEIITGKHQLHGVPMPLKQRELMAFTEKLKSDPFVPQEIRSKLLKILDKRSDALFHSYYRVLKEYQQGLCEGKYWETLDENKYWINNQIVEFMCNEGAGVQDNESAAHEMRLEIQKYYEKFNPIKN